MSLAYSNPVLVFLFSPQDTDILDKTSWVLCLTPLCSSYFLCSPVSLSILEARSHGFSRVDSYSLLADMPHPVRVERGQSPVCESAVVVLLPHGRVD